MLQLGFTAEDLARTRLASSALLEVVTSVRVLQNTAYHPPHLPWVRRVRPRFERDRPAMTLLTDLITPSGRLPNFLTPPPNTPVTELATELEQLRRTPTEQVREDIDDFKVRRTAAVRELYRDPAAGLARLADDIEEYWQWAVQPHWPRIRRLLDGDVFYRAKRMAEGGARLLFADLHPQISWTQDALTIRHRPGPLRHRTARGNGLLLLPSAFTWPYVFTMTTPPWQPSLVYPARGVAALWESGAGGTPDALVAVLGRTKAKLLAQLECPATTTELASRLGLTTGGISQHLTALRAAGLVTATRDRQFVLYVRTILADDLVAAAPDG